LVTFPSIVGRIAEEKRIVPHKGVYLRPHEKNYAKPLKLPLKEHD